MLSEERPEITNESELKAMREIREALGLHRGSHSESVTAAVRAATARTLSALQDACHGAARSKGWHDGADWSNPQRQLAALMLITTEIAEAAECVRVGQIQPMRGPGGKPEGLPSELADAVIRVLDMAGAMGINIEAAVAEKVAFNATRPHRHGGKIA